MRAVAAAVRRESLTTLQIGHGDVGQYAREDHEAADGPTEPDHIERRHCRAPYLYLDRYLEGAGHQSALTWINRRHGRSHLDHPINWNRFAIQLVG